MMRQGVEVFVATEPVDMRYGFKRLCQLVRERMGREPRSLAMFVFISKNGRSMKVLTWDGSGLILHYKKLDIGMFELPLPSGPNERSVQVSEAVFEAMFCGMSRVTLH